MRICVIGDSHAACLRDGWTQLEALYPGIVITFFASPGDGLAALEWQDGYLKSSDPGIVEHLKNTSGGLEAVPLEHFDAFLVQGLKLHAPRLSDYLSQAVVRQCVTDMAERSINLRICKTVILHTLKPVYSGHTPLKARETGSNAVPYAKISDILRDVLVKEGAALMLQPDETLSPPIGTKEEYTRASRRLGHYGLEPELHKEDDVSHMNASFGVLVLRDFLARLGVTPVSAPA